MNLHKFFNRLNPIPVIIFLLIYLPASGQEFTLGLTAGFNTGPVKISEIPGLPGQALNGRVSGYEAGLAGLVDLRPLYIKPGLLIERRSGMLTSTQSESPDQAFDWTRFQAPVLFSLRLIGPLGIEAGPVYHYLVNYRDVVPDRSLDISRHALGYRAGAFVMLGRLNLYVSYHGVTHKSADRTHFDTPKQINMGATLYLGNND